MGKRTRGDVDRPWNHHKCWKVAGKGRAALDLWNTKAGSSDQQEKGSLTGVREVAESPHAKKGEGVQGC